MRITRSQRLALVGLAGIGLCILVIVLLMVRYDQKPPETPRMTVQQGPVAGLEANLQGTLAVDTSTNCLVVRSAGRQVDVAWPQGWVVAIRDGDTVLVDATGKSVGKVGADVSVVGGFMPPGRANAVSCTRSKSVFAASALVGT